MRHDRACNQTQGHEWKAEQQRAESDFVNDFERGQAREKSARFFRLQRALLNEIKQAGAEAQNQRGVAGEDQSDVGKQPAPREPREVSRNGCWPVTATKVNRNTSGKTTMPGDVVLIDQVHDQEDDHDQESQHGLGVVHRSQRDLAGELHGFCERNQMEDHAQVGSMQGDAVQQIAGAGQRHQCIEQADGVTTERDS